jgi:hypothetical protein
MTPEQSTKDCYKAFAKHDYFGCARQVELLINSSQAHEVFQLLLISLQRLGRTDSFYNELVPQLLTGSSRHPWHHALFRLTVGLAQPAEVLRLARTGTELLQAHYYIGARLLTIGDVHGAQREFDAVIGTGINCIERDMAISHRAPAQNPKSLGAVAVSGGVNLTLSKCGKCGQGTSTPNQVIIVVDNDITSYMLDVGGWCPRCSITICHRHARFMMFDDIPGVDTWAPACQVCGSLVGPRE